MRISKQLRIPTSTAETEVSIYSSFDQDMFLLHQTEALRLERGDLKSPTRRDAIGSFLWFPFRKHRVTMAGIRFLAIRSGSSPRRYLHIHGNESTARQVLSEHLIRANGTAWIIENTQRLVEFRNGRLDPNRMFSGAGAERSLRRLNPAWSEAQIANGVMSLDRERHKLLDALLPRRGALLFALHNNSEGYSVLEEVEVSKRTALNERARPHEFFLCSDAADFEVLARSPYNVVLQDRPAGPDDGSLSRLCAKLGIRYVNLETAIGEAVRQREMLAWADSRLRV